MHFHNNFTRFILTVYSKSVILHINYIILDNSFEFVEGCAKGKDCSSGRRSGWNSGNSSSFESCQQSAIDGNYEGFSYSERDTGCQLATKDQLKYVASVPNWGVYRKKGTYTFKTTLHNFMIK